MSQPELSHTQEDRLVIHNLVKRDPLADFAEDVRRGLSSQPKHLFPKYLYDELGSRLFAVRPRLARCRSVVRDKPGKAEDHKERADDDNSHPC